MRMLTLRCLSPATLGPPVRFPARLFHQAVLPLHPPVVGPQVDRKGPELVLLVQQPRRCHAVPAGNGVEGFHRPLVGYEGRMAAAASFEKPDAARTALKIAIWSTKGKSDATGPAAGSAPSRGVTTPAVITFSMPAISATFFELVSCS